jgi:hypothetical protein
MRHIMTTVVLAGAFAAPGWAQNAADRYREPNEGGRYSADAQQVPSGYLPPPGACRVWYDGRPAGYQPPATSCAAAERVARRVHAARVIYGGDQPRRGNGRVMDEARAVPFEQGFKDGRSRGYDDRRDDRRFDPTRHERYEVAARGYESRLGDRTIYQDAYREGFRAGYAEGYRGVMMTSHER